MGIQLNHISGLALALVAAAAIAPAVNAQETVQPTIPQAMQDLQTTYSGDHFHNRTIRRQALRIVGFSFPEREIEWDANATSAAVRDLWQLQVATDPTLRVPDLATPFNTSLLTMPSRTSPAIGSEFIFETF